MARVAMPFKATPARQRGVDIVVSDGWLEFMKGDFTKNAEFWRTVDRYFRRAMVVVENQMRRNATAMGAVATGFLRSSTASRVTVDMGKPIPIVAEVGTLAWYDILIEKGLGRHSPTGKMPAKYKPTAEQKAIVPTREYARHFWKPSPKVPRPFISMAARQTRTTVTKIFREGFSRAFSKMNAKGNKKPRHSLKAMAGSSPRLR